MLYNVTCKLDIVAAGDMYSRRESINHFVILAVPVRISKSRVTLSSLTSCLAMRTCNISQLIISICKCYATERDVLNTLTCRLSCNLDKAIRNRCFNVSRCHILTVSRIVI